MCSAMSARPTIANLLLVEMPIVCGCLYTRRAAVDRRTLCRDVFLEWRMWTWRWKQVKLGKIPCSSKVHVRTGSIGYSGGAWPTLRECAVAGETWNDCPWGEFDAKSNEGAEVSEPPCKRRRRALEKPLAFKWAPFKRSASI